MIGTVENIDYDNGRVLKIVLRFPPGRDSPTGKDELKEIITCERIGQGTFGTVYRALCDGYSRLAVKVSTGKASRLREELEVLSKVCTHGKLLLPRFEFGALNKQADLIVIGMELCVPSTLHDMLLSTKITNEADMLYIGYQCAQTIGYVHEQNCIHRDVKLQNFVFDLNGNVKLIDFGLSCSTLKPPAGDMVAGTMSFMSPEMAHNALYREKRVSVGAPADIWSLGIVLFSIFTQRNPYPQEESSGGDDQDKSNEKLLQRVAAGKWSWPPNCTLSADLRRLVENVLVVDPEKRPSITEVLKYKVWNARRRSSPAVLTAFLGVQDDFFLSHDEEHLLRAVEQRSAGVAANVLKNRHRSTESQSSEDIVVDEELKIEEHGNGVDGAPGVQVYDVRASGRKKSKPIREISQVIEEHVKEKSKSRRGKSNREDRSRAGSTGSEFKAKRVKKKEATPPPTVHHSTEAADQNDSNAQNAASTREVTNERKSRSEEVVRGGEAKTTMVGSRSASRSVLRQPSSSVLKSVDREEARQKTIKRSSGESKRSHKKKTTNPAAAPSGVSRPSRRGREVFEVNLSALLEEEAVSRHLLSSLLIVEQSSLLEYLFLIMNEDVERYNITWLAEQQAVSAAHEHVFTFVKNIEKYPNYHEGFVCDMCDYDFLPTGKNKTTLHFYHCLCGRDFCEFCYPEYKKKCTCTCCKKVHPNSVALRDHLVKMKNVKQTIRKAVDPKGRSSIQSPSLSPRASVKPSPSPSPPRKSDKHKTTAAAATKKAKTKATRQSPPAKSASPLKSPLKRGDPKRSHKKRPPTTTVVEKDEDEDLLLPNTSHMSIAAMVQTSNKRTPRGDSGRLKTVEKVAEGPWRPLAKLKSERESTKQLNQPTPQEREALLHGEWIRHFYYYPPDDTEFYALVYHAQPGRTGSVFLSTDYTIHSSILSPLERQLFIVEETDVNEGNDITRVYSLAQARANRDVNVLFQDMQAIATHDTNMLKQHRAPVRMAVYQTARSAYSCNGDPYLYIRWFRSNADGSLFIFLLSNGAVQAFVGGEYEIRWFDEHRKFIIRPNGICEKIDEVSFPLGPEINKLLYDSVV